MIFYIHLNTIFGLFFKYEIVQPPIWGKFLPKYHPLNAYFGDIHIKKMKKNNIWYSTHI